MSALEEEEALVALAFAAEQALQGWGILRRFCDFEPYSPHLLAPLHCLLQQFWACLHHLEAMLDASCSLGDASMDEDGHLATVAVGSFRYLPLIGLLQRGKDKRVQKKQKHGTK